MNNVTKRLFLFLFIVSANAMTAPDDPTEAADWYQEMARGIENCSAETNRGIQIEKLGQYVFKLGSRMPHYPDPRWHGLFKSAQSALLSIPGHAKYFADALERQRSSLKPREYRGDYHNRRRLYLEGVLPHLPSPETISELGKYLYDERDNPPPPNPRSDADPVPSSTRLAYMAIMSIGLRQPPVTKEAYWKETVNREDFALSKTRVWFSKVKEGNLAFSFVGQKVDYRFNPDGTWETIALANPPDDAPEATKARDSKEERAAKRPSQPPGRQDHPWIPSGIWLLGGLLLAGTIGYWTWTRHRRG